MYNELNATPYQKAGDFNLSSFINLISYQYDANGSDLKRLNIHNLVQQIEIFESISSNVITGSIAILDATGTFKDMQISGFERLEFKCSTPGLDRIYDFTTATGSPVFVHHITNREQIADNVQQYVLHFCSMERAMNQSTLFSHAYTNSHEAIVQDILRTHLKSKKNFFFEPSSSLFKHVIPYTSPFSAINYLAGETQSKAHNSAGYRFYETSQGFYFRSIASMMSYGGDREIPHKWSFASLIASQTEYDKQPERKDIERRMSNALKYEFTKPVDTLRNINEGFYANKLTVHDAFNKTLKTHTFNYMDAGVVRPHTHMNKDAGLLMPNSNDHVGVPFDEQDILSSQADSKTMVVTETSKVHNDYEFTPTKDTLPFIVHDRAGFKNHNLSLLVFGNTQINAGDIIKFTSPLLRPEGGDSPYTSGRYIVMAIKHVVNIEAQRHEMVLKCYKDSVRNEYPREEDAVFALGKGKVSGNFDIYREQRNEMAIENT